MNTHNYNKDLDPRLFGRDAAGASKAPAATTRTQQKPAAEPAPAKKKAESEFRITDVTVVVPADGLKKDQPFDITGTIQPLVSTLTSKKIRIELITRYKGTEDRIGQAEADIEKDNSFTATCKQLFYHDGYQRDKEKPADAKFTLEAKATGTGAEKEATSKPVELPMATSIIILKKGNYDDTWCAKNEATHPKSGKEYVPDNKVKKLQENLFTFRFLPQGSDDGFFGPQTEAAVKQFQESAAKPERKRADDIKIVKAEKITYDGTSDGIVEEKTEKEIALWFQNNWVRPDSEYRKDDYDDNGVKNKFGERGGDKHHPGTGITDLQKDLAAVKAYKGKIDGIYGEKTEAAVALFQEKASAGDLVDEAGKKADIKDEEKLNGHRQKVGDGPTVEELKKARMHKWLIGASEESIRIKFAFHDNEHTGKYVNFSNARCEIVLNGTTFQKSTNEQGVIEIEGIKNNTKGEIRIVSDNGITYQIVLEPASLDKPSTVRGVAQRLRQLGLLFNNHDNPDDAVFQIALKAFQGANGLKQTGKIDEPTQQKLQDACSR